MKYKKQIYILWSLPVIALFSSLLSLHANPPQRKYSAEEFLNIAQHPPGEKTWAQLEGTATHKRKSQPVKTAPLYLGIRFTPEQTFAQVSIGKNELYSIGQSYYAAKEKVTVIREGNADKKPSILADFGIKPDDLTMSFLFWKLEKELPKDSIKGQACRVFLLKSPDGSEIAKTYISSAYFFPLKVEWTKSNENKPYRMLEVTSFKKVNNLWLIDTIMLCGPGWRTKINFQKINAGLVENGTPKDLFLTK
jgi:hypothetical protein